MQVGLLRDLVLVSCTTCFHFVFVIEPLVLSASTDRMFLIIDSEMMICLFTHLGLETQMNKWELICVHQLIEQIIQNFYEEKFASILEISNFIFFSISSL